MSQDSHGNSGLVYDWISEIEFTVDANFLMYLHTEHGIDVNPESGDENLFSKKGN